MGLFSNRPKSPELNRVKALALIPVKDSRIVETRQPDGHYLIHYPTAPLGPKITALLDKLGRKPTRALMRKVQLDGMGSEVWALIDNQRSVADIIDVFARRHRLPAREAEVAVTQFIRSLGQRELIGLK